MEQSPYWGPNSHSSSQEILRLLCNPNAHYHVEKKLPLLHILTQINPVHNFPHCFSNIHSNIILPSTPRCSEWSGPSVFPTKILCDPYKYIFFLERGVTWRRFIFVGQLLYCLGHCAEAKKTVGKSTAFVFDWGATLLRDCTSLCLVTCKMKI